MAAMTNRIYLNSKHNDDALLESKKQSFCGARLYQMELGWDLCVRREPG